MPVPSREADLRAILERWTRSSTMPHRAVRRSQIVLLALDGLCVDDIALRVHVSRPTVRLWIERFERGGPDALLHDAPGRGRHAAMPPEVLRARLDAAHLLDAQGRPISLRRAAAFLGVSASAVWRSLRKQL